MRGLRNDGNLVGYAGEIGGLFQGAMSPAWGPLLWQESLLIFSAKPTALGH